MNINTVQMQLSLLTVIRIVIIFMVIDYLIGTVDGKSAKIIRDFLDHEPVRITAPLLEPRSRSGLRKTNEKCY